MSLQAQVKCSQTHYVINSSIPLKGGEHMKENVTEAIQELVKASEDDKSVRMYLLGYKGGLETAKAGKN